VKAVTSWRVEERPEIATAFPRDIIVAVTESNIERNILKTARIWLTDAAESL